MDEGFAVGSSDFASNVRLGLIAAARAKALIQHTFPQVRATQGGYHFGFCQFRNAAVFCCRGGYALPPEKNHEVLDDKRRKRDSELGADTH